VDSTLIDFKLAQEYIVKAINPEEIVVSVAEEFFNSCASATDNAIDKALEWFVKRAHLISI